MMKKGDKKTINAWAFYDLANSSYSLVISSALFPIYFHAITTTETSNEVKFLGHIWNSESLQLYCISLAFLLIAALNPILSSIADISGKKKKFMYFFSTLGAISCSSLFFFESLDTLWVGILGSILAAIGYAGSIVFYNAFLPEIAEEKDQDKVSAKGFAMGYLGSSLLLIFSLTMILFPQWYGNISTGLATRIAFVLVGIWWFAFAQYTFSKLKDSRGSNSSNKHYIFNGYLELKKVWKELKDSTFLLSYLVSFFFFNMGVQTVMYAASLFGQSELHLDSSVLITIILIIQFVAILGAYTFSSLSKRYGNMIALSIAIIIWIFVCIGAFLCNKEYGVDEKTMFMGLAAIVGFVMGGIQSLARSTYSKMLPETLDHASYFSFFDVCDKLGTVIGTFAFGLINEITGSMRSSIIVLAFFFIIGLILLLRVRRIQSASIKYV
ncbi:MAG TPA: MFS transporter [Bacteroidia bacterium]|nr:MFS transporter [Bacteroidota bacterium]MBP9789910.1 MFS transporter [Bacteroidia bacterium]MBK7429718.1 MFS transporter [Bacteroidota bacterium]MBP9922807.1 MFS transporter [Bacteroidia bacterium]HQV99587.1 MFS transporter [Bacteroidia bacterium]